MEPPPGFPLPKPGLVWILLWSLYSLKQAACEWYLEMKTKFSKIGWTRTDADYTIFTQQDKHRTSILGAHVNDILLAVPKPSLTPQKDDLLSTFNMHYMGDLHWYTGIKIVHDHAQCTITISQDLYIHNILQHFNMAEAHPTATLMATKLKLEKLDAPTADVQLYQSMLGSVMYAMTGTRPNLAFAVGYLSRHSGTPSNEHLSTLKRVYCYLVKTKDMSLTFDGKKSDVLYGFTDLDWAGDPVDHKSVTGIMWILCGAPVGWSSRKQTSIVLSSTEAEYIAITQGTHDALWYRHLLSDLSYPMHEPTTIYIDNQSAIAIAHNEKFSERMKHLEVGHQIGRAHV